MSQNDQHEGVVAQLFDFLVLVTLLVGFMWIPFAAFGIVPWPTELLAGWLL